MTLLRRLIAATAASVMAAAAHAQTPIGFQAELSDLSTVGVSGTVTIVGPNTLRFSDFNYDGRGGGLTELRLLPTATAATILPPDSGNSDESRLAILNASLPISTLRGPDPDPGVDAALFPGFNPSTPGGGDSPPFVDFNGDVDFALPAGTTLSDFAGISVFCIPFVFDFGSGIFTSPADFDNNGEVSAADFVVFRDTVGTAGLTVGQLGDGNSDGRVTPADFQAFLAAFGTVAPAADPATAALIDSLVDHAPPEGFLEALSFEPLAAETASVPEPGAVVLGLAALSGLAPRRKKMAR